MSRPRHDSLPRGIVPVVQTPFDSDGKVDRASLDRLVEDAIAAGAAGFLTPAVASEVAHLEPAEREQIIRQVAARVGNRVPLIVGASSDDTRTCGRLATLAAEVGAVAWLVAVPQALYGRPDDVVPFFREASAGCELPLVIQDLQFGAAGLSLETIHDLHRALPRLAGLKIETAPAGPKYTAVRNVFGPDCFVAGGWAVMQMIEALDRGVDAMIPESSMVRVYSAIHLLHATKRRDEALRIFQALLPVLAFTNQELTTSIAFFKRLLVRKGIFAYDGLRMPGFVWDDFNRRIADELIDHYLALEREVAAITFAKG